MADAGGLSPGKVVAQGRYRLEKKLGQGGFGEVWKGWDDKRGESVALKTILPTLGSDRSVAARFRREIATAARLTHPNIVRILDTGQFEDGRPFFSMEFLDGQPIERFTHRLSSSLLLFDQLLEALAFAHARGVIHRDLKPDNVIVMVHEGQLHLKLLDFGIALIDEGLGAGQAQVSITRPGLPVGTVPYMSPEQASGEPSSAGPASDLYSVGVMLYEILSGERPFEGDWMFVIVQHVSRAPKPLVIKPDFNLEDPRPLTTLVEALLKKPYHERPECAAHVRQTLAQIRESLHHDAASALLAAPLIVEASADSDTYMPTMASTGGSSPRSEEVELGELSLLRMHEAPVVGREVEQEALWEAVARVTRSRRPEAIMVSSPPNRGKSRLARWLVEEVHRAGLMRVLNVYISDGGLPAAMHAAIYRWLRLPKLERQHLVRRIDEVLDLNPADRDELCEFLMAGGRISDPAEAERLKGWARLWQKFIWRLTEYPNNRSLLVWIDGPDEGDMAETSGWIELLLNVTKIGRRPVLVVWTVEPKGESLSPSVEKVSRREDTALLELSPLSPEAQAQLARYYAPDLAEDAIAVLQERSMGNPFFLREMLLGWLDEGALQASEKGLSLSVAAQAKAPEGLDRLVRQRLVHFLERYPDLEEAAQAMMILAFLGQSFPDSLTHDALKETPITSADLVQEGFLEVIPGAREQELTLSSKCLRDALLEMATYRGVHGLLVARGIELRIASGLSAMIRSDWELAERCLAVGWNLIDEAPKELVNELWSVEILDLLCCMAFRRREAVLLRARTQSVAWVANSTSAPRIQQHLQALVGIWGGAALLLDGDFQGAPARIQGALALGRLLGDTVLEGRALHGLGRVAQMAGDRIKALEFFAESSLTFRKLDRHTRSAQPLLNLFEADAISDQATVMAEEGDLLAASVQLRMLLGLYQQYSDRQGEAHTLTKLVRIMRKLGDVAQAAALIVQARAILQLIDDRWGLAVLQWEEATACLKSNDLERADVNYRAAAQLFASFKDEVSEASCTNARGELARKGGRLREAVEHYLAFRASMARLSHTHGLGLADINLGWTYMAASNPQAAQQHFHVAYETLNEAGPRSVLICAMIGWSWSAVLLNDVQGAVNTLHNAQGLNEGRPVIDEDTVRALAALSLLAADRNQPALAEAVKLIPVQS